MSRLRYITLTIKIGMLHIAFAIYFLYLITPSTVFACSTIVLFMYGTLLQQSYSIASASYENFLYADKYRLAENRSSWGIIIITLLIIFYFMIHQLEETTNIPFLDFFAPLIVMGAGVIFIMFCPATLGYYLVLKEKQPIEE